MPVVCGNPFCLDSYILVEDHVVNLIYEHAQRSNGWPEAGGILLGYRRGDHLHITHATEPSASDERSRVSFDRMAEPHQSIATELWRTSKGTIGYLGEWHTHPEADPVPSQIDLREWRKITNRVNDLLCFLIVGNAYVHWLGVGFRREVSRAATISRACKNWR